MKTIYFCEVTMKNGTTFDNPLLPNELHLVGTLAREYKSVNVTHREVDEATYKYHFG